MFGRNPRTPVHRCEVSLLTAFADQASLALEKARLLNEAEARERQATQLHEVTPMHRLIVATLALLLPLLLVACTTSAKAVPTPTQQLAAPAPTAEIPSLAPVATVALPARTQVASTTTVRDKPTPALTPIPVVEATAIPLPTATIVVPTQTPKPTTTPQPTSTPRPTKVPIFSPTLSAFPLRSSFAGIRTQNHNADATLAVGPTKLLLAINSTIEIHNKNGGVVDSKQIFQFFDPVNIPNAHRLTDPYVTYDPDSQRFFVANANRFPDPDCEAGTCQGVILLAVSKSADPKTLNPSDWHLYALDRTEHRSPDGTVTATAMSGDFDHLSIVGDALVISMDTEPFNSSKYVGNTGNVRILDKSPLINGEPVTDWFDIEVLSDNVVAAINFGHPDVAFLMNWRGGCEIVIRGISNLLTSPSLTTHSLESPMPRCHLSEYYNSAPIYIHARAQAVYRDGNLWIARIVVGMSGNTAIHWAQIDVSTWPEKPKVIQQGILGTEGTWYFAPTIIVDASGNVVILYGRTSDTEFLSAHFTGRLASDPPNTLRISTQLKEGEFPFEFLGPRGLNRFTDYYGIALDPDDQSIWMLGMYAKTTTTQGTWVGNLVLVP